MAGKREEWAASATPEQFLKDWYFNTRTEMIKVASMWHQAAAQGLWDDEKQDGAKRLLDALAKELEAIKELEQELGSKCVLEFATALYLLDGLGPDPREKW